MDLISVIFQKTLVEFFSFLLFVLFSGIVIRLVMYLVTLGATYLV